MLLTCNCVTRCSTETVTARDEVLDAWKQWDDSPRNPALTNQLVRAEQALGLVYGIPHQHVRSVLTAWRRAGVPRATCISAFIAGAQVVRDTKEGKGAHDY